MVAYLSSVQPTIHPPDTSPPRDLCLPSSPPASLTPIVPYLRYYTSPPNSSSSFGPSGCFSPVTRFLFYCRRSSSLPAAGSACVCPPTAQWWWLSLQLALFITSTQGQKQLCLTRASGLISRDFFLNLTLHQTLLLSVGESVIFRFPKQDRTYTPSQDDRFEPRSTIYPIPQNLMVSRSS